MLGQKGIPTRQGGIERHVEELSTRLAAMQGMEVFVYVRERTTGPVPETFKGVHLVKTPSIPTKNLEAISHTFFSVMHALFVIRPDVYHFHAVGPSTLAWIPRIFAPKALVVSTFHCRDQFHLKWSAFARAYLKFGEWASARLPHMTIAVSRGIQELCAKSFRRIALYIPNGVQVTLTDKSDLLAGFGLEKRRYVVAISRLVKHKRVHDVIRAFKAMLKNDGFDLAVVGGGAYTEAYEKELKDLAADEPRVKLLGMQTGEAFAQLLNNAALFVTASEAEGLPITLLEAAAAGVPILASDIPEHREVLDGEGRLFPVGDTDRLAEMMKTQLARTSAPETVEASAALQRRVEVEYDWERIAKDVARAYATRGPQRVRRQARRSAAAAKVRPVTA